MTEPEHEPNKNPPDADVSPSQLNRRSPLTEAMLTHDGPQFTERGNPIDPPDRGSGFSRLLSLLLTILVVAIVVLWQNTPDTAKQRLFFGQVKEQIDAPVAPDKPAPGAYDSVDLLGRIFLRNYEFSQGLPVMQQILVSDEAEHALSPEDRVRVIMISAEFEGTEQALSRLEQFRAEALGLNDDPDKNAIDVSSDDLILQELNALQILYEQGPEQLSADQIEQLTARYGLIARVALTHHMPENAPQRKRLTEPSGVVVTSLVLFGVLLVCAPLAGLVLLILTLVRLFTGRLRMRARVPLPGGSVYLETYAVFVASFIALVVGSFLVEHSAYPEFAAFSVITQWLLLLSVFWPLARGTRWDEWKMAIGWHPGEGILKEIGCGVLGYFACLPLYILGVLITSVVLLLKNYIQTRLNGGVPPEAEPVTNSIFELIARRDMFFVLFFFILATCWAPIVEESIFRGALYRHLRARLHWVAAALVSALLFAFMHDYGPLMVAPLIALGFSFAFMREWRGSIIAPMTAHFIHNFTILSMMIAFFQLIKDPM